MNTNGANSDRGSAVTSRSEWPADEAAIIDREAELARAALLESVEQLKSSLRTAADVRLWTQHHPWISVAVAAVAGFAVAKTAFSGADGAGAGPRAEGASAGRPSRAPETAPPETGGPRRPPPTGVLLGLLKDALAAMAVTAIRAGTEGYAASAAKGATASSQAEASGAFSPGTL